MKGSDSDYFYNENSSYELPQVSSDLFNIFSDFHSTETTIIPLLEYRNSYEDIPNNETNENVGMVDFVGADTVSDESILVPLPQTNERENSFSEHRNIHQVFPNSETNENIGQIDFINTNTISDEATLRPRSFPEINQRENNSNENNPLTLFSVSNNSNPWHTKYSRDNARRKIYSSCMKSIYLTLKETTYQILGIDFSLIHPAIKNQIKYSFSSNKNFFDKTIYNIFVDSIPKKVKKEVKTNKAMQKVINKDKIDELLAKEMKNERLLIKKINELFKLTFFDFLMAYLNDEKEVYINDSLFGKIKVDLEGFRTYKECFGEEYTEEQRKLYKEHIIDIKIGNIKGRNPRSNS